MTDNVKPREGGKIKCAKFDTQFFILPSVGIVYRQYSYKFGIAFAWLWFGMNIKLWGGSVNGNDR